MFIKTGLNQVFNSNHVVSYGVVAIEGDDEMHALMLQMINKQEVMAFCGNRQECDAAKEELDRVLQVWSFFALN